MSTSPSSGDDHGGTDDRPARGGPVSVGVVHDRASEKVRGDRYEVVLEREADRPVVG